MLDIKEFRKEILNTIEYESRITTSELAIRLGVSEVDVINEMQKMEAENIICGFVTLINWEKTSDEKVTALIEVKVTPQRGNGFDAIAKRIYQFSEVSAMYLMSGGFDFTVIIEGKTMREVALFVSEKLSTLESVLSTATHFVLKRYKDYGIVLDENKTDERMKITP